jgi:hypothetical protein
MIHHVRQIVDIQPYSVTVIFDQGVMRKIDFSSLLEDFPVLKDKNVFQSVHIDNYPTLAWDGLARIKEIDGTIVPAPLDFCPDTLYAMSVEV